MNFFKYNGCKKTAGVLFKDPINKKFQAVFKYDLFHFREDKDVSYKFSMTNKLSLLSIFFSRSGNFKCKRLGPLTTKI